MEKLYSNNIINAAERLFRTSMSMLTGDKQEVGFEQLRDTVLSDIDHVDRVMFEGKYSATHISYAKYALVAYIDEFVMKSDWQHKIKWMSSPLQLELFGDHVAGKKFFEKLNEIVLLSSDAVELLELYYLCLEMGYEGSYRVDGIEKLQALKVNIKDQIDACRDNSGKSLLDRETLSTDIYHALRSGIPSWVVVTFCIMIIVLFYVGYEYSLENLLASNNDQIEILLNQVDGIKPDVIKGI